MRQASDLDWIGHPGARADYKPAGRREPGAADSAPAGPTLLSVIIPVHNEAEHLRECLQSLCTQDYPAYELIVVDNGSTDQTAAICAQFPQVCYIYFDRCKSSYAARNEGVRHAQGEVLVFFDADQTAMRNCLSLLLSQYVAGDAHHIYCGRLIDDPRVPAVVADVMSQESRGHPQEGKIRTAYVAVPRELYYELGGFKEQILSGGDFEFFQRGVKLAQVHVCREVGAYHYWAKNVKEVLAREERYAFGQCLRAKEDGKRAPSIMAGTVQLVWLGTAKLAAALLVPLRFPRQQWRHCWEGMLLHWRAVARRLLGVVKFKLGAKRAGDLPKTKE